MMDTGVFATASLAARIERAECSLIAGFAARVAAQLPAGQAMTLELGGGVAACAGSGSPINKVVGWGFAASPSEQELETLELAYAQRGIPVQIEFSSLGDPALVKQLCQRGYELCGFENVLGLPLSGKLALPKGNPLGVDVAVARADESTLWVETMADGFLVPDTFDGPPTHESFTRAAIERNLRDTLLVPGFERYLARRAGELAGGASLRLHEGVAQLCGAATLPAQRRCGVQHALLRPRLLDAAQRGCDIAIVTTQPGSKSQQNVQRFGFTLLYTRAILVKPAPTI